MLIFGLANLWLEERNMGALKHLNKYFVRYKWHLLLGIVFIVVTNFFNVYAPTIISDAVDDLSKALEGSEGNYGDSFISDIVLPLALMAGLSYILVYLIKGIFLFLTRMSIIVMSRHIEYDLKNEIYQHYQRLDLAFYKRNNTGDLMNRISEDVSRVRMYTGPAVMYTINLTVLFVICIAQMVRISPELTLYSLAPLPVMSVLIYLVSNLMNRKAERVQKQQSNLSTMVQEAFSGIRVFKAYNREQYATDHFNEESKEYRQRVLSQVKVDALFFPVILLLIGLSTTLVIYLGGRYHIADPTAITKGDILLFVFYINMLTWPFASVGWVTSLVQRAAASQTRINEFLNTVPAIQNPKEEKDEIDGEISFENVSFTYPDSGVKALQNVTFKIEPGKTLAIIGRTGSGKSTITHLVTRQYDATNGEIKVDDTPIETLNTQSLRESVGYVPQEIFLFSDTISNNISFGDSGKKASDERIEQAAKDAAIHDNISTFPKGFETLVGERGITLSGGQKQRVSIARAILRKPRILIFDDCLSAVDTETEELILRNLRRIMEGRTTILISHRVSTVKDADHIIVLDDGQIVEEGNHSNLLQKAGVYADLYHKQLLEEEKN